MIVAMCAMRKVQMVVHEIIDVVTVRDGLMTAVGTVAVAVLMSVTRMGRCASGWITRSHCKHMFVHMVIMQVMEMAVV